MPPKKANAYKPKPRIACSNCGTLIALRSNTPKDPATGAFRGYCSKPDCAKARWAWNFQRRQAQRDERIPPRTCSNCGCDLPKTAWRASHALGRWCSKPQCADARDFAFATTASNFSIQPQIELLENTIRMLIDAVAASDEREMFIGRQTCKTCGHDQALEGWVHPNEQGAPCEGTLNGAERRRLEPRFVRGAYPLPKFLEVTPEEVVPSQ